MPETIQPHNQRSATVWSSGGAAYDRISRGLSDSTEHAVVRLNPQPGERVLDLATGTDWTSLSLARSKANAARKLLAEGFDPSQQRKAEREAKRASRQKK